MDITRRSFVGGISSMSLSKAKFNRPNQTENDGWRMAHGGPTQTGVCSSGTGPGPDLKRSWGVATGAPIAATPVVGNQMVFVGNLSGRVVARSVADGAERWATHLDNAVQSPCAVGPRMVFVVTDPQTENEVTSIHALDASTGEEQWRRELKSQLYSGGPCLADGAVCVADGRGWVYSLDRESGVLRWKTQLDRRAKWTLTASDSYVFAAGSFNLFALDRTTGELRWRARELPLLGGPAAVFDGTVYLSTGVMTGKVFAIDEMSGQPEWQQEFITRQTNDNITHSPVVTRDSVITSDSSGAVVSVDRVDGSVQWKQTINGTISAAPSACNGTLYVPRVELSPVIEKPVLSKQIVSLSLSTGDRLGGRKVGPVERSSPAIADGRLFVGTVDGKLVAFEGGEGSFSPLEIAVGAGTLGSGGYLAYRLLRNRSY